MESASRQQEQFDHGLEETFSASDPIAVGRPTSTEGPRCPVDRKAPRCMRSNVGRRVAVATVGGSVIVSEF
jgi:hypothetical protein